ncbi:hypothetical protein FQR65_LT01474 [Abscondita terminalis]|nr:hypothetical protein FQR65_LT01474 [Abscondita terminalis]
MSNYVSPFLVLNLGSEMIFVIAQRLQAQGVEHDRSSLVLSDIISVLISPQLIAELTKPQPPLSCDAVRVIIEDVTQSSIMRLDSNSMTRLWDLITMVFKWQVSLSPDIMSITLRHLYEIETYLIHQDTHLQLHRVQNVVENFNKILDKTEKEKIREGILTWLQDFNIKVALLMRMGLQNEDGTFVYDNRNPVTEEMLKNLGENIYEVTQNGKVLEEENKEEVSASESYELQAFADEMLGKRKLSGGSGSNMRLLINDGKQKDEIKLEIFDKIDVSTQDSALQKIFSDLNLQDVDVNSSINDDLLDIIGSETA